jgi:hypothetical protein
MATVSTMILETQQTSANSPRVNFADVKYTPVFNKVLQHLVNHLPVAETVVSTLNEKYGNDARRNGAQLLRTLESVGCTLSQDKWTCLRLLVSCHANWSCTHENSASTGVHAPVVRQTNAMILTCLQLVTSRPSATSAANSKSVRPRKGTLPSREIDC